MKRLSGKFHLNRFVSGTAGCARLLCRTGSGLIWMLMSGTVLSAQSAVPSGQARFYKDDARLAKAIKADPRLNEVKKMAEHLVAAGFTAGSGYGEVWIRDFNTFIRLSCQVMPRDTVKEKLRLFFQMQGDDGNIIDGYIPKEKARAGK